jgi:hypothetical protein|uniref:Uncharacterized protein n=1 Tax=viral metagenome TaxID=1070528 RepID=A0A6C0IX86_9ZZZZ
MLRRQKVLECKTVLSFDAQRMVVQRHVITPSLRIAATINGAIRKLLKNSDTICTAVGSLSIVVPLRQKIYSPSPLRKNSSDSSSDEDEIPRSTSDEALSELLSIVYGKQTLMISLDNNVTESMSSAFTILRPDALAKTHE